MKTILISLLGLLSLIYLLNPTLGIFELMPDNLPIIGNLDEALATGILLGALRFHGLDLTRLLVKHRTIDFGRRPA